MIEIRKSEATGPVSAKSSTNTTNKPWLSDTVAAGEGAPEGDKKYGPFIGGATPLAALIVIAVLLIPATGRGVPLAAAPSSMIWPMMIPYTQRSAAFAP